jgi:regulator of protease activity HflC (stomatin/prohibitin superfamily)
MMALRLVARAGNGRLARHMSSGYGVTAPPMNFGVHIVPQQSAYVVERLGRFSKVLHAGIHLLLPGVDRVGYVHSLKEVRSRSRRTRAAGQPPTRSCARSAFHSPSRARSSAFVRPRAPRRSPAGAQEAISVPSQTAITKDNVSISIDGILYVRIIDAYKASYGIDDPHFAVTQLAQTTMRSELGKISLDRTFQERDTLNANIVASINAASEPWGIQCMRYEIRDIVPPKAVRAAMELEAEAERRKRASILDSEGDAQAAVNAAEGEKTAAILRSEASQQERINLAEAEARATELTAGASAAAVERLAKALGAARGADAVSMRLAEQYIKAFGAMAKQSNTLVVPANIGDASGMVAAALAVFKGASAATASVSSGGGGHGVGAADEAAGVGAATSESGGDDAAPADKPGAV